MPKIVTFVSVIAAIAGCASVRGEVECATAQEQGAEESRCSYCQLRDGANSVVETSYISTYQQFFPD